MPEWQESLWEEIREMMRKAYELESPFAKWIKEELAKEKETDDAPN